MCLFVTLGTTIHNNKKKSRKKKDQFNASALSLFTRLVVTKNMLVCGKAHYRNIHLRMPV